MDSIQQIKSWMEIIGPQNCGQIGGQFSKVRKTKPFFPLMGIGSWKSCCVVQSTSNGIFTNYFISI